jgi:hypothetical protein
MPTRYPRRRRRQHPAPGRELTGPDWLSLERWGRGRRPLVSLRRHLLVAGVVVAGATAGCRSSDTDPAAQPVPEVTTFEQGRFDDPPQFPRSEPVGPRTEVGGVVTRSYRAEGAFPAQILEFYRDALDARWQMEAEIDKLGVGTFRADWVGDDYRLRVSATEAPTLESESDAAGTVVAQYNLSLHPR